MKEIKRSLHQIGVACCVLLASGTVWAKPVPDGFRAAKSISSTHFDIQLAADVDSQDLVRRLGVDLTHQIMAGQDLHDPNITSDLAQLVDAFFVWACGVLDMHLYSYRGMIKVVVQQADLDKIYQALYGRTDRGQRAFYVYEINTLYISAESFTKEILGHELAHTVTSNFFVVQPPAKVAEVLSGYIEYQLRKK